ncbi:MAG: tetratricopeptide repeat protein, partial [Verrucomicrobiae bacterium]|nr:tetratricopeptide repeat protein [Verrucomicrobiae bacterium]
DYPAWQNRPELLYQLGAAEEAIGHVDKALEWHRRNVKENPSSAMAPYSLFNIAAIQFGQGKYDAMRDTLNVFFSKYPNHPNLPDAMNLLAAASQAVGDTDGAVQVYAEVAKKYPASETGARAMLGMGQAHVTAANGLALHPNALPAAEKAKWDVHSKRAIEAFGTVITDFSKSAQVEAALEGWTSAWRSRIDGGLGTIEQAGGDFDKLQQKLSDRKSLGAEVALAYGGLLHDLGQDSKAIDLLQDAYTRTGAEPLPLDSARKFLVTLLEAKPPKAVLATTVAERLAKEHSSEPALQAEAFYWMGRAALEQNVVGLASDRFKAALQLSPPAELKDRIDLARGRMLEQMAKYDEAVAVYQELQKSRTLASRAQPILRMGYALEAKADAASLESAYKRFQEIVIKFEGSPEEPEALFKAVDLAKRLGKAQDAAKFLAKLRRDYPKNAWCEKAAALP